MGKVERIPLSNFCPLERSQTDYLTKQELRDRAAELFYDALLETSDLSRELEQEFDIIPETADLAVGCIHRIMRNSCSTCVIGVTATGNGIIRRPPIQ